MNPKIQLELPEQKSNAELAAEKSDTRPSPEKQNESQKCECPPGCVGLPCCT